MISKLIKYLKYRPILKKWIISGLVTVSVTGLVLILSAFFLVNKLYRKEEEIQAKIVNENTAMMLDSLGIEGESYTGKHS